MKLRHLLLATLLLAAFIMGCSTSSSGPTPPALNVAFSPQPPASMDTNANVDIVAIVSNDSSNGGVTWNLSCGGSSCGSLSATSSPSGAAVTYKAPASIPGSGTVVLTATSVADTSVSASASIQIQVPSAPIAITLNPAAPSTVPAAQSTPLTAVVGNDASNAGVTWTVKCGSSQCGSFIPGSTSSGVATTFLAPATVPAPATVTVTATAVADTTKSVSATIAITPLTPVLSNGSYVFHVSGEDGYGPYFLAGAVTVANGVITGGEQDLMDGGIANDTISSTNSSITRDGGNVQIVLNTQNPNVGVNGIETFRGTVVSSGRILISEFDTSATATGSLDLQTSTAIPSGSYAFTIGGVDGSKDALEMGIGGVLQFSNGALNLGDSVFDYNDGLNLIGQGKSFASGTVSAPDQYGRFTLNLSPSTGSGIAAFELAGYVVGADRLELLEVEGDGLGADLGGEALGQGSKTGTFNLNNVVGQSYAFGANGADVNGLAVFGGAFSFNADGTVGGVVALNDLTNHGALQISSGTYAVDPTGRISIRNVNFSNADVVMDFQLYIDGSGNALEIGVDSVQVSFGNSFAQTNTTDSYAGNFAVAAQGFGGIESLPFWGAVGPLNITSSTISGYTDYSVQTPDNTASITTASVPLSGTLDTSTGLIQLNGLDTSSPGVTDGFGYYPIDNQRLLAIEVDNNQLGLMFLEQVQPNQ